jgi:hypothetical protein
MIDLPRLPRDLKRELEHQWQMLKQELGLMAPIWAGLTRQSVAGEP